MLVTCCDSQTSDCPPVLREAIIHHISFNIQINMPIRRVVDGSNFWNPAEGMTSAANLLKLAREWTASSALSPGEGTKDDLIRQLKELETGIRSLRPKVKAEMQEWISFKIGRSKTIRPIQFTDDEREFLLLAEANILRLQGVISKSNGDMQLREMAIDYPKAEVRFTQQSYFDLMNRSFREIIDTAGNGKLAGPQPGQIY